MPDSHVYRTGTSKIPGFLVVEDVTVFTFKDPRDDGWSVHRTRVWCGFKLWKRAHDEGLRFTPWVPGTKDADGLP